MSLLTIKINETPVSNLVVPCQSSCHLICFKQVWNITLALRTAHSPDQICHRSKLQQFDRLPPTQSPEMSGDAARRWIVTSLKYKTYQTHKHYYIHILILELTAITAPKQNCKLDKLHYLNFKESFKGKNNILTQLQVSKIAHICCIVSYLTHSSLDIALMDK